MSSWITRYGAEVDGHTVEVEFDRRKVVLNEVRLHVDGTAVDRASVFYGEKELRSTVDGREVVVAVVSGMVGEPMRPQARRADGAWVELSERAGTV